MSSRLRDAVAAYFTNRDWPLDDRGDYFASPVSGKHGEWIAFIDVREDEDQIAVHSMIPVEVAPDMRTAVALYLTRANFGLPIGNFELDLDDGEIRFKTSLELAGSQPSDGLIDRLFITNIVTVDQYLPGLRAVLGGTDPAAAVTGVEGTAGGSR